MKEYTILAFGSALATVLLDIMLGTRILSTRRFWVTLGIMFFFKIPSNGYLTGRPIVLYDPANFLGIRLGTIPVEDFFYGFGLITLTLVLWEYFKQKERSTADRSLSGGEEQ
jgi:lycopene cyclase domain-containing protein